MFSTRRVALALMAGVFSAIVSVAGAGTSATTVNVSLWDKGDASMEPLGTAKPMGLAMAGTDRSAATVGIKIDRQTVVAGNVTFAVTNASKGMVHEMILAPVADVTKPLPYLTDLEKVDEDAAGHLGEVSELEPGAKGALTMTLKPGTYILFCNIPGHYVLGMWTLLTVTG